MSRDAKSLSQNFVQSKITDILNKINGNVIKSDSDLLNSDRGSMVEHNVLYTKLLKAYVNRMEKSFEYKQSFVKLVTCGSLLIMGAISIMFCYVAFKSVQYGIRLSYVKVLLPVCVSFLTTYIVIPKIIIKFCLMKKKKSICLL